MKVDLRHWKAIYTHSGSQGYLTRARTLDPCMTHLTPALRGTCTRNDNSIDKINKSYFDE